MADMIEGERAIYVGDPAWHRHGKVVTQCENSEEALKVCYPEMLYKVPLVAKLMLGDEVYTQDIVDTCLVMRSDGKEIGPVSSSYELLQPYELFHGIDRYLEKDLVTIEAGGSLCGGKKAWILCKIKDTTKEVLPSDPVCAYLLAATGFDGSMSYLEMLTPIRVVCQNTLNAADNSKGLHNARFKFRHTKNMRAKISDAKDQIEQCMAQFYSSVERYKALASIKMNQHQLENYVTKVFISDEMLAKLKEENKDPSPQLEAKVKRVIDLLDTQAGLDLVPAMRGTAWQGYNAVTQYLTHEHGRNSETRLNAQWFGESAQTNRRAMELAFN